LWLGESQSGPRMPCHGSPRLDVNRLKRAETMRDLVRVL